MVLMDHYYRGVAYPKDSFAGLQVFVQAATRGRYRAVASPAQTLVDAATRAGRADFTTRHVRRLAAPGTRSSSSARCRCR